MEKSGLGVRSYLGEDQRDDPKEICARKTYLETCGGVVPRLQSPLSSFYDSAVAMERCGGGGMICPLVAIRSTTARSSRGKCGGRRRSSRFTLSSSCCSWWCVVHIVVVVSVDSGRHFIRFRVR